MFCVSYCVPVGLVVSGVNNDPLRFQVLKVYRIYVSSVNTPQLLQQSCNFCEWLVFFVSESAKVRFAWFF